MTETLLRCRSFVGDHIGVLVVACLVLGALGGWVAVTGAFSDEPTTSERTVTAWSATGSFDHRATVTDSNPLFEHGATLENRSTYFTAVTPTLDGEFTVEYAARESGTLSADVSVDAVLRGVDDGPDGTTLWESTERLTDRSVSDVEPGEPVTVSFSADVADLRNRSTDVQERLGTTYGQAEVDLVATTNVTGMVNGEPVDRQLQHSLPITFQDSIYRVADAGPQVEEFTATAHVSEAGTAGPVGRLAGPLLFLVGVGGVTTLATGHRREWFDLDADQRARLAYLDDRSDFDEWITCLSLPSVVYDRPRGEADSLADLADFAIDTGSAVVEDTDRSRFVVVHDGCCYVYEPPESRGAGLGGDGGDDGLGDTDNDADTPTERPMDAEESTVSASDGPLQAEAE